MLIDMDKKKIEREILALVYNDQDYDEIEESEQPDFIIFPKNYDTGFGVEITEFFLSESNARLRKIPDYFEELLDDNKFRHKDDIENLQVVEFEIKSAEGTSKGFAKGIIQELPSPEQYSNMIVKAIEAKNMLLENYSDSLSHINLIVFDTECRLRTIPIEDFYRYFFISSLKLVLYRTKYREIFLVTVVDDDRRIYIPLKMMLLLANVYMFQQIISDYPWENSIYSSLREYFKVLDENRFMMAFAQYLKTKANDVFIHQTDNQVEVIYGNNGIVRLINEINVRNYNDYPISSSAKEIQHDETTSYFSSSEFSEFEDDINHRFTFSTELANDVKGEMRY